MFSFISPIKKAWDLRVGGDVWEKHNPTSNRDEEMAGEKKRQSQVRLKDTTVLVCASSSLNQITKDKKPS